MKKLKQSVRLNAKKIVMDFDGTGYATIKGNVNNNGLSLGFLQWNFRQRNLQPLLIDFFRMYGAKAQTIMKEHADELKAALKMESALEFAKEKMNDSDNKIKESWFRYLKNLCETKEFQEIQDIHSNHYFKKAVLMCNKFNIRTERAFCLFFDIAVQNASVSDYVYISNLSYMDKLWKIVDSFEVCTSNSYIGLKNDFRLRKECILKGSGIINNRMVVLDINDSDAFEEDVAEYVNVLKAVNIIRDPEYWIDNAVSLKTVKGEYVEDLILRFLKTYIDYDEKKSNKDSISILKEMRLIGSADYLYNNAISGGKIDGEYAAELIHNMGCKINKKIKNSFFDNIC